MFCLKVFSCTLIRIYFFRMHKNIESIPEYLFWPLPQPQASTEYNATTSTPSITSSNLMYDDEEPAEEEPSTPDYGAYYEDYINSLLTTSPSPFSLDEYNTPEKIVDVRVSSPKAKRMLFSQ